MRFINIPIHFTIIAISCAKIDTATENHVVKVLNSTETDVNLELVSVDIDNYYPSNSTCTNVEQEKTVIASNVNYFLASYCQQKLGNPRDSFATGYPFKVVSIDPGFIVCRWNTSQPGLYFGTTELEKLAITAEIVSEITECKEGQTKALID